MISFKGKTRYAILVIICGLFFSFHPHRAHATPSCQYADIQGQSDTLSCHWYATVADIDASSIKIELPPQYITTTKKERHFTPDRFTPFDDMQVSFTVPCPMKKAQIWDEAGSFSGTGYFGLGYYRSGFDFGEPSLGVSLYTTDQNGTDVFIASLGTVVDKYYGPDDGTPTKEDCSNVSNPRKHTFVLHGWPYSLAASTGLTPLGAAPVVDQKILATLIDSIKNHRRVWISIKDGGNGAPLERAIPTDGGRSPGATPQLDNCVQLWGYGDGKKIVTMAGITSGLKGPDIVAKGNLKKDYFDSIEPFHTYELPFFTFYADLAAIDDTAWYDRVNHKVKDTSIPSTKSSCNARMGKGDNYYYFHFNNDLGSVDQIGKPVTYPIALTDKNFKTVFIGDTADEDPRLIVMHETGHAIGNLDDEYIAQPYGFIDHYNNCRIPYPDRPKPFSIGSYDYGILVDTCRTYSTFRSSTNSIMRHDPGADRDQFNRVSCGLIVSYILGGYGHDYWKYPCSVMNGVIKPGTQSLEIPKQATPVTTKTSPDSLENPLQSASPSPKTSPASKPTSTPKPTYSPSSYRTPYPNYSPWPSASPR